MKARQALGMMVRVRGENIFRQVQPVLLKPVANIELKMIFRKSKDIQIKDSSDKGSGDMYSELKKLKELLDSKILTQDEFNAQIKSF